MEMNTNEQGKDSLYFDKNTKGYNVGAKVYFNGTGSLTDTVQSMKDRLLEYKKFLEDNFPSDSLKKDG